MILHALELKRKKKNDFIMNFKKVHSSEISMTNLDQSCY